MEEKEIQMTSESNADVIIECKNYTKQEVRDNLKNNPEEFIAEINKIFASIEGGAVTRTFDKVYQKKLGFSYSFFSTEANKVGYFYDRDNKQYVYTGVIQTDKNDTEEIGDRFDMEKFDTTFGIGKRKEHYDSKFQVRVKTSTLDKLRVIESNSNLKPAEFYDNVFQYFISTYENLHGEIGVGTEEDKESEE